MVTRRDLMLAALAFAAGARPLRAFGKARASLPRSAAPLPLSSVRLLPSDWANAVEVNRRYLLRLSPDRLLHNFMSFAGLPPKGAVYGGWESDTIAGHTLGHYLSALVAMHAQTDDAECRRRADYIVGELARAQARRGTGYVGALKRKRQDGQVVDGEEIFGEVMRGEIRSGGFDLNGAWSPLYTVHKTFAGLLDVHGAWQNPQALDVLLGLAGYFERVFAALNDEQMQTLLGCEYGGLNESYAELFGRTGDSRWRLVAERIYDRKVLDPLAAQQDQLANIHANTQVPKLIGLARLYELTGQPDDAIAARFFWTTVTQRHSYVIGGNADREYFTPPDAIAQHISEQTCEHCNTYNMLKLTRKLYGWRPDGALFDFYERAHLNHVMAAQHPQTGGFTYMTPLMSGAAREFSSTADDAFWCCVGSGMEVHAKHGESIFWEGDGTLLVNLYIPAEARWAARDAQLRLETRYPYEPESRLTLTRIAKPGRFTIALRVPAWAGDDARLSVNGKAVVPALAGGYALIERRWRAGDVVAIRLPLELRLETAPGSANTVAVLRGPMVLAADLGPASEAWKGVDPAFVGDSLLDRFEPVAPDQATYVARGVLRPADLNFAPFYRQYERRSAVYFKRFSDSEWQTEEAAFLAEQARLQDLGARSVDTLHLGEMQPERDHQLTSEISYPVSYRGRNGRDARAGGFFEFDLKTRPGALVLQATYWGDERRRDFEIFVDGVRVASQHLEADQPGKFFDVQYPLTEALTRDKATIRLRFAPRGRSTAGPVFGVRLFTARPVAAA